ncbi:Na+/H+ antiporter NhaA [Bacteroides helcogenes]|uniref:Na(+)/H(+) antiporter NhaA n=1 Tax=Bacteroides helcogenes (strain ATCC 35417 / DSM 20613 / JCM 6297 / CCUG 15421 / P 36-108) TaxID=693979 RepID=E6SVU0_BACT6|nr:Na+/H+ antiporter NhaA [Bacteroides helcogenes]ADV44529.1 sodium/proton antiporter, NhaA family [Bacteroides helcogenes P 36-108]MDY5238993.1 Na+/H+ antiporter NhaA [Bacteroides helcogenes]
MKIFSIKNRLSLNVWASILLFMVAIVAACIANSPLAEVYQDFLSQELHLRIGGFNLFSHGGHPLKMIEFINDCLMAVFFLAVGLEIKRELLVGELSSFRKAVLPFIAACGGMLLPVIVYSLLVVQGTPDMRGMAIPMATDIAFSLGVLSLLGKRVPLSLKIFLTAFAVVDDIGGILVIAIFYSSEVAYWYLVAAVVLYGLLYYLGRRGMTQKIFYLGGGIIIWYLFLQSGIHSTISGVLLAFVIPARPRLDAGKYIKRIQNVISEFPVSKSDDIVLTNEQIATLKQVERASDFVISPLQSLEDNLHGVVNFVILPLFAFANAGVVLGSGGGDVIGDVSIAVAAGLLVGKFAGIYIFTWLAVKSGLASMPAGMNWKNIGGVALLGGIGFTVSLFIANLSFAADYPDLLNQAKFGVLLGTFVAGVLGYVVLNAVLPKFRK